MEGEASLRGHLKAEGNDSWARNYVPPDEKDDRASRKRLTSGVAILPMRHSRPIGRPLFPNQSRFRKSWHASDRTH